MIIGQSIFQLVAILILNFLGKQIIGLDTPGADEATRIAENDEHKTIVFNTFVFCQIFNQFNARVLDRSLNVFRGLFKNVYFLVIMLIMVAGQVSADASFFCGCIGQEKKLTILFITCKDFDCRDWRCSVSSDKDRSKRLGHQFDHRVLIFTYRSRSEVAPNITLRKII